MEIVKFIAYILCSFYFIIKGWASLYVLYKFDLKFIQKHAPIVKNKNQYWKGFFEHLFFLISVNLLYFY